jgi:hypothetical protein
MRELNTFKQLLRVLIYYDGSDRTTWIPQVELPAMLVKLFGIKHTPF